MAKEMKSKAKVISYNTHVSEVDALSMTISTLENEIKERELQLEHRDAIITGLQAKNKELEYQYHLLTISHNELIENYNNSKGYWESNTKILHNEMDNLKAQISALKLSNISFEAENSELKKNQKKWYHFF